MSPVARASLVQGPSGPYSPKKTATDLSWLPNAVYRARPSRCPNAYAFFVVSLSSRRALLLPCGKWVCRHCGSRKKAAARLMIEEGIRGARSRGERVRFITLTSPPEKPLTTRSLYEAFNSLRVTLRRSGHLKQYFGVVETTKAGALHLHLLATGRFLPQAHLSKLAAEAGFGEVVDIREVKDDGPGSYLVKALASYATKANAARLASHGGKRIRPVRSSRAWYPGGMAEAEKEVGRRIAEGMGTQQDAGPWLFVVRSPDGSVRVPAGRRSPVEPLTTGASAAEPQGGAVCAQGGRGRAASGGLPPRSHAQRGDRP